MVNTSVSTTSVAIMGAASNGINAFRKGAPIGAPTQSEAAEMFNVAALQAEVLTKDEARRMGKRDGDG
jgi:hypothetical protein